MEVESWQQCVRLLLVGAEHSLFAMHDFSNLIGAANILATVIKSSSEALTLPLHFIARVYDAEDLCRLQLGVRNVIMIVTIESVRDTIESVQSVK